MKTSTFALAASVAAAMSAGAQQAPAHHATNGVTHASAVPAPIAIRSDGIRTVTVVAADYAFTVVDTIPAGLTEIRLQNRWAELHHVWLVRLSDGKRLADVFEAMKANAGIPAWAHDVGGPNTPGPGGESSAILRLTPGRYAMLCLIPSSDGTPHVMKGMAKEITVTPAPTNFARANLRVSATMTLTDYAFGFSQPLVAGRQIVRVKNDAAQSHEVLIVRVEPGKSVNDVLAWMEKPEGPPPGAPVGGVTPMARGEENLIALDLTPGEYGLICFVPDAKDGKPHIMHGMVRQFTVPGR